MLYFSKLKIFTIIFIIILSFFFFLPNFFKNKINFLPDNKIILGLDLQGGSYLLLEVDADQLINERIKNKAFETAREFRKNNIVIENLKILNNHFVFNVSGKNKDTIKILNSEKLNAKINVSLKSGKRSVSGVVNEITFSNTGDLFKVYFTEKYLEVLNSDAVEQSIEVIRSRIDQIGTKEPSILSQGLNRIIIEAPGIKNPDELKLLIGKTAKLNFRFLADKNDNSLSFDKLKSKDTDEIYNVSKQIVLSGENLIDAQPGYDNVNASAVVNFKLNNFGAKKFASVTKNNIGKRLAIIIDDVVVSAPVIRDAITTGNGQISGNFDAQEANNFSILLRSGALPAPLKIIEERSVGPDLGKESVEKGVISLIIGFILVISYIFFNYKIFGLFANLSLFLNIILLLSVLSILEATLTLPGIAGIVLTVGMAVDANVLIYERIKEEQINENNFYIAFDNGYRKVLTTLLDANITTLIAGATLYYFGSGPIKGFAVTLTIGILTSLFTTYVVGRLFVSKYLEHIKKQGSEIKI